MLRIIDAKYSVPNNYKVSLNKYFQPGQIAGFEYNDKEIYCTVSNGITSCAGIIDDIYDFTGIPVGDTVSHTGKITVWNTYGLVAQTDQFEYNSDHLDQKELYVNTGGKLSTFKQRKFSHVAEIISIDEDKKLLTFRWLGIR